MENLSSLLDELSRVLRHLHKALVDAEAENFGPISGPFQLLNLVTYHEHFVWLHQLSAVMVELDELRDSDESVDATRAAAFRAMIESLIKARAPAHTQFRERYTMLLQ